MESFSTLPKTKNKKLCPLKLIILCSLHSQIFVYKMNMVPT